MILLNSITITLTGLKGYTMRAKPVYHIKDTSRVTTRFNRVEYTKDLTRLITVVGFPLLYLNCWIDL